jgi:hypothetical protein
MLVLSTSDLHVFTFQGDLSARVLSSATFCAFNERQKSTHVIDFK